MKNYDSGVSDHELVQGWYPVDPNLISKEVAENWKIYV